MPKRWVVGGIWVVLMSAGFLTCIRNAAAEQPAKPGMVQKVTYLGAKHIPEKDLPNITGVRQGTPLNPLQTRQGCQKIMEKYFEQGRWLADCQLLKGGDPADTEVVFQITEGPKVKVSDIQFAGNAFASAAQLRQKIHLRGGATYNREAVEAGINELYTLYRDAGYRDVRIALEIKRDSAPGEVTLIYHIHEE
jgi:outer membrane protein insertion porin family